VIYLYGVVDADAPDPPDALRGLEDAPVRLVAAGPIAGIIGDVPDDAYSEAALETAVADLEWVGPRGLAHERVLTWFADRGPVIPLALFSLHAGEDRVRTRLHGDAERFRALLARLRGRREWLVRLWREADAPPEAVDAASPALRDLAEQIAAAAPGRRFLLEKKREALRTEERRRIGLDAVRGTHEALAAAADGAVSLPPPGDPAGARRAVLNAAYLVAGESLPAFRRAAAAAAAGAEDAGLRLELTGPWPPYHFARFDAD
jgi:hypothetical protein